MLGRHYLCIVYQIRLSIKCDMRELVKAPQYVGVLSLLSSEIQQSFRQILLCVNMVRLYW